jgi:cytochrome c
VANAMRNARTIRAAHTVDKKLVGPAYKEVAAKYAGAAAPAKLEQKVKNGHEHTQRKRSYGSTT